MLNTKKDPKDPNVDDDFVIPTTNPAEWEELNEGLSEDLFGSGTNTQINLQE